MTPRDHFFALRRMVPGLFGLAILDSDSGQRMGMDDGGLQIKYWDRYEIENYFITPAVLKSYATKDYSETPQFTGQLEGNIDAVMDALILERVFQKSASDLATWKGLHADAALLLWEKSTERIKLSEFAEAFFRELATRLDRTMLLRKSDLHQLVKFVDPHSIPQEVEETLDLLKALFDKAKP